MRLRDIFFEFYKIMLDHKKAEKRALKRRGRVRTNREKIRMIGKNMGGENVYIGVY